MRILAVAGQTRELRAMSNDLKGILKSSFFGALGVIWVTGGLAGVFELFDFHWALGWLGLFIWVWGCWAAVLYFDLKRFIPSFFTSF